MYENVLREVRRYCEEAYPLEACGLIAGIEGSDANDRAILCRNVQGEKGRESDEGPEKAFSMCREDIVRAICEMKEQGEVLKGVFHSHCDEDAELSERDMEWVRSTACLEKELYGDGGRIMDGVAQIVVPVFDGKAGKAREYCGGWDE